MHTLMQCLWRLRMIGAVLLLAASLGVQGGLALSPMLELVTP